MSSYDDAVQQLKEMHTIIRKEGLSAYNIGRDTYMTIDTKNRNEMNRNFKFMEEEGWIKKHTPCSGIPISYVLTSLGIKVAEDLIQKPIFQHSTYNIATANNSIIGDNAHNNIINNGISFEELQVLINKNVSDIEERKEVLVIIKNLLDKMDAGEPIEKGILSKINDKIKNCAWLASPITNLFLQYFTKH